MVGGEREERGCRPGFGTELRFTGCHFLFLSLGKFFNLINNSLELIRVTLIVGRIERWT